MCMCNIGDDSDTCTEDATCLRRRKKHKHRHHGIISYFRVKVVFDTSCMFVYNLIQVRIVT